MASDTVYGIAWASWDGNCVPDLSGLICMTTAVEDGGFRGFPAGDGVQDLLARARVTVSAIEALRGVHERLGRFEVSLGAEIAPGARLVLASRLVCAYDPTRALSETAKWARETFAAGLEHTWVADLERDPDVRGVGEQLQRQFDQLAPAERDSAIGHILHARIAAAHIIADLREPSLKWLAYVLFSLKAEARDGDAQRLREVSELFERALDPLL